MQITKADLSKKLDETEAELEAALELLAAIAQAASVPTPQGDDSDGQWKFTMMNRLIAIGVHANHVADANQLRTGTERLQVLADKPLSYVPYGASSSA